MMADAYLSFSYILSLCGNKGFMIDIKELNNNKKLNKGMVWIILKGKVKDRESPTLHKLLSVPVINLEVNVEQWRDRLLLVHHKTGRRESPVICD